MMYSENSIKKIEDALHNLIQEDNYFLEDCYHHENHFEKRFHFETGAVVSYVGYYLYSEQKKISCDKWLNDSIKKIVDEFHSVGSPIEDISITSVLLNFLDSSKNVNCVHICSDGLIYVETETNENISTPELLPTDEKGISIEDFIHEYYLVFNSIEEKEQNQLIHVETETNENISTPELLPTDEKGISIEDFIHEYLVFDSIEEKEQNQKKIQSVFDYHISILKHIETQDISSINPKSRLYREILEERKINKYFSFFPLYYYGSCYKRVFFVLTILQSDYLYPEFDDEGKCIVKSYPPIIGFNKVIKIQYYLQSALWQLLQDRLSYEKRKSISESLKSAKAAIMSRNMSHNLGSHVMFYIKQKLQSVSKIVDNKVLDNIIPGSLSNIPEVVARIKENKDIELPFLVGLGRFINYLQERQDYIATIATDYIPANSTISFKDFVYDELKPELRYQRHHSNSDDAGWKSGNLLLDYIAYSEGYRSCDDIEILFGEFNGNTPVKDSNPDKDFQKLREFNIAVPGGVIGRQALFSIFENIIRNAAKHSERRSDNKLVLQLSLLEKDSDILANLKAKRKKRESEIDGEILKNLYFNNSDKYHFLRIKVDMPNPNGVIDTLVDYLADPYLDDNGVMSETTKGLKEMRISAAWLRGYSIDTAIPSNEPPVISIYSELFNKNDENDKRVTLSYILCIPKPCRVAFVKDEQDREYKTINEVLGLYGCKVFVNPFKLEKQEECDKLINEIANYEIVCMPNHLEEQLRSFISSRYIMDNETTNGLFEDLIKSTDKKVMIKSTDKKVINDLVGSIYEEWFNITYNVVTPKLVIADEKAVENKKTEKENGSLSSDSNVILTATGSVTEELVNNAVVYSTHFKGLAFKNDEQKEPVAYNKMLERVISIESVTGNNSTARLIRQDEWNKEWKTKILSAAMARIAIFDERIFRLFISTESKVHQDGLSVEKIKKIKTESNDSEGVFQENLKVYGIPLHDSETIFYAQDDECIQNIIDKYLITYSYDVAQKNHERRIWAFDIRVPEKVNNIVEIIGYNVLIGDRVGAYIERKTDAIITIAKISRHSETSQYNVELCDDKKVFANGNGNIFDYITIHQGVLDKIYTTFGIKDNATEKFKVTNALHRCFSKYHTPEDFTKFLPNFIIHSGRSKPSKADMPQPQPFVQFAAVDHAVKDCKYTLVELLATAHYEKSNNNN